MTRTANYRLKFWLIIIGGILLFTAIIIAMSFVLPMFGGQIIILALALLFIPGRFHKRAWGSYFEGQKLQAQGKHLEAVAKFNTFISELHARPSLKKYIWLTNWVYSKDIEVLAFNNMGVSLLWLNNLEETESALKKAIELDPESPLPYYNLSLVYHTKGEIKEAVEALAKAEALGYKRSSIKSLAELTKEATDLLASEEAAKQQQEEV
jgi:tetratricopeptide (TPR) repeat protein